MKKIVYILLSLVFFTLSFGSENLEEVRYKKIISMSMAGDEILYDLVPHDRILGMSGHSNTSEMKSVLNKKLDKFNKFDNNVEKIIEAEPDIVVAGDWLKREIVLQLEDADINVYIYKTPRSFEEIQDLIRELGNVLDCEEKSQEIIDDMNTRLLKVQERIKGLNRETPRVLEYSYSESTNGKGSVFGDMLQKVFAENIASENGIYRSAKISKEKVIELDPEIIISPTWEDVEITKKNDNVALDFLTKDISCQDIKAVKDKKVYVIPGKYIYIYSQYIIEGIEELAELIYQFEGKK